MGITYGKCIFFIWYRGFIASCLRFMVLTMILGFIAICFFLWYCPSPESLGYSDIKQEDSFLYVPRFISDGAQLQQGYYLAKVDCTKEAFHVYSLDCYILNLNTSLVTDGLQMEYKAKRTPESTDYYIYEYLIKNEIISDAILKRPMSVAFQDGKAFVSYEYRRQNSRIGFAVLYCAMIILSLLIPYLLIADWIKGRR